MRGARQRLGARRARISTNAPFMITSMLDMFTIILVFLLNFLDPTSDGIDDVDLPSTPAASEVERAVVLTVTSSRVLVDGALVISLTAGQAPADAGALEPLRSVLGARRAAVKSGAEAQPAVLSVQCDRSVPYATLSQLLDVATEVGFGGFRFVVLDASD